jgi:hypothetical protein
MNAGEYAKEKGIPLKDVLDQFGLTHHKQKIPEGENMEAGEKGAEETVEQKPAQPEVAMPRRRANEEDGTVKFYWRDGKNLTFTVKGGVVNGTQESGRFYKTDKSVIRLDPNADRKAIAYLRQHPANEANGGKEFGEFDATKMAASEKGSMIDRLMAMDVGALAAMTGGGVAATRKSKGQLISEILGLKG